MVFSLGLPMLIVILQGYETWKFNRFQRKLAEGRAERYAREDADEELRIREGRPPLWVVEERKSEDWLD